MINDTLTVIWREQIYLWRGSRSLLVILRYLAFLFIFGVIAPWQSGRAWVESPLPLLYWTWFAVYLASAATTGSFAREREQHTLETLLSTRLPDAAILLGKILSGVVYGGALVLACAVLGQGVAIATLGTGEANFYQLSVGLGGYLASLLAAFAIGALAALTALQAQTTRQAQASMSLALLVLFLPLVAVFFLPDLQQQLQISALHIDTSIVVWGCLAVLAAIDLLLWALARHNFRRNRLFGLV
jgi:ABC-2 type transport system permease protein